MASTEKGQIIGERDTSSIQCLSKETGKPIVIVSRFKNG